MNLKSFSFITAIVFLIVSLLHLARILFFKNSIILIGHWEVPISISTVVFIMTAYLSYKGFQISSKKEK
tara:strand:+ start:1958 stop:2164 length:207 start_codon:yes stop_codon:yes gene_type:complete